MPKKKKKQERPTAYLVCCGDIPLPEELVEWFTDQKHLAAYLYPNLRRLLKQESANGWSNTLSIVRRRIREAIELYVEALHPNKWSNETRDFVTDYARTFVGEEVCNKLSPKQRSYGRDDLSMDWFSRATITFIRTRIEEVCSEEIELLLQEYKEVIKKNKEQRDKEKKAQKAREQKKFEKLGITKKQLEQILKIVKE